MRKRLLVGAIAAAVIGVVIYFLSQPKKGTVEWHKSQYLKALERLSQNTWKDKLKGVYRGVTGRPPQPLGESDTFLSDVIAFERHRTSLIQLGYLQKASVSLTNALARTAMRAGFFGRDRKEVERRFIAIHIGGENVVNIIAPTSDLPAIEAAIRQADVPASK